MKWNREYRNYGYSKTFKLIFARCLFQGISSRYAGQMSSLCHRASSWTSIYDSEIIGVERLSEGLKHSQVYLLLLRLFLESMFQVPVLQATQAARQNFHLTKRLAVNSNAAQHREKIYLFRSINSQYRVAISAVVQVFVLAHKLDFNFLVRTRRVLAIQASPSH